MANLLARIPAPASFPPLDGAALVRLVARYRRLDRIDPVALVEPRLHARLVGACESELDELEQAPSLAGAHELLDRIDRERHAHRVGSELPLTAPVESLPASPGADGASAWLLYRPGRSLETGEAEIASRGFFDVRDRPPLGLWLEVLGRREAHAPEGVDLGILCWLPPDDRARARAGARACCTRSLLSLADEPALEPLAAQLCEAIGY